MADLFDEYKQTKDVALDFAITGSDGTISSGKMWSQAGKFMKLEATMGGVVSVMIIDLTANTMIMYDPSTKQGMKTTVSVPLQDPSSYANDVNVSDVQDLGTEKVNGETCRVVQYTTSSGTARRDDHHRQDVVEREAGIPRQAGNNLGRRHEDDDRVLQHQSGIAVRRHLQGAVQT